MKKNKKKCHKHWTNGIVVIILYASCLNHHLHSTSFAEQSDNRREAEQEEEAEAGTDVPELKQDLRESRRQLQDLRESYSDLYLKHKATLEELAKLRMRAANLLGDHGGESEGGSQAEVLTGMLEMYHTHSQLYRQIDEFGDYLQTVLSIIEPSQVLRREIERQYLKLQNSVTRVENLPSIVAWRGGDTTEGRSEARVYRVEKGMQIVVLEAGRSDRVRPGSMWRVNPGDNGATVKLRVVETRSGVSAAIPVEGDLSMIAAGMEAEQINSE